MKKIIFFAFFISFIQMISFGTYANESEWRDKLESSIKAGDQIIKNRVNLGGVYPRIYREKVNEVYNVINKGRSQGDLTDKKYIEIIESMLADRSNPILFDERIKLNNYKIIGRISARCNWNYDEEYKARSYAKSISSDDSLLEIEKLSVISIFSESSDAEPIYNELYALKNKYISNIVVQYLYYSKRKSSIHILNYIENLPSEYVDLDKANEYKKKLLSEIKNPSLRDSSCS